MYDCSSGHRSGVEMPDVLVMRKPSGAEVRLCSCCCDGDVTAGNMKELGGPDVEMQI